MSKVRADKNGKNYVIVAKGIYRPEVGESDARAMASRNWGMGVESSYKTGCEVKVLNILNSGYCKVIDVHGKEEVWVFHGNDLKNPEECFYKRPAKTAS